MFEHVSVSTVPDFRFGWNPELFPNPAEIPLRQKIPLEPDSFSRFEKVYFSKTLHILSLEYLIDFSHQRLNCLRSTYCLHCCGINYCGVHLNDVTVTAAQKIIKNSNHS